MEISVGGCARQRSTHIHFRLTLRPYMRRTGREPFLRLFQVVLECLELVLPILCNESIVLAEVKCGEFARNVSSEAGIAGHLKGHK